MKSILSFPRGIATAVSLLIVFASILAPSAYALKANTSSTNRYYLKVTSPQNNKSIDRKSSTSSPVGDYLRVMPKALKYGVVNLKKMDPTNTKKMKLSRAARESISVKTWATSWTASQIAYYESRNNCKDVSSNGIYRGKWQMDPGFWATYGGLKFATSPDLATCEDQDIVAHNGWVSRHYEPWQTYSLIN